MQSEKQARSGDKFQIVINYQIVGWAPTLKAERESWLMDQIQGDLDRDPGVKKYTIRLKRTGLGKVEK